MQVFLCWCFCLSVSNRVHGLGAAQLANSSWAGSSAWIGYMTWIKAPMCRSARASGFCGPGGLGCCSEASKYCRGCDLIPPFDRDFDSDSDATLDSGWFVQTVGHRRIEPGQAIARASYVSDSASEPRVFLYGTGNVPARVQRRRRRKKNRRPTTTTPTSSTGLT